jgi:uncharacterized membrane protein
MVKSDSQASRGSTGQGIKENFDGATFSSKLLQLYRPDCSHRGAKRLALALQSCCSSPVISHFSTLKHDLAAMIPPPFTGSLSLIYLTGVLEIAGAAGLLTRVLRTKAAWSLAGMMLASVSCERLRGPRGRNPWRTARDVLWIRGPLHVLWFATLLWVARAESLRELPANSMLREGNGSSGAMG